MRNEAHSLLGIITFQLTGGYARYDKTLRRFFMTNTMYGLDFSEDPAAPDFPTNPIIIGNGATLMSNAGDRKGQGMRSGRMTDISLAIQTPVSIISWRIYRFDYLEFNLWTCIKQKTSGITTLLSVFYIIRTICSFYLSKHALPLFV